MAEQIEQMGTMLEINQKVCRVHASLVFCLAWYISSNVLVPHLQQLEELQYKYDAQVEQSSDLSNKLLCTRVS